MKQQMPSGCDDPPANYLQYGQLSGCRLWSGTEGNQIQLISAPGTFSNFRIKLQNAPGVGETTTIKLRVNGADTTLTVTIAGTDTTGVDSSHTVHVNAGDRITLSSTPSAGIATGFVYSNIIFSGDNDKESNIIGGTYDNISATATEYNGLQGQVGTWLNTEAYCRQIIPTNGVIQDLYIMLTAAPGAGQSYDFTLMKNGAAQALTVQIANAATTGNDTNPAHAITVAPGDSVSLRCVPTGTPAAPDARWGTTFKANIDGESIILGQNWSWTTTGAVMYSNTVSYTENWTATELNTYDLYSEATLKKFHVQLSASPGAGKNYVFAVREGGADTSLKVTIADAASIGNNIVDTAIFADGDIGTISSTPTGTPTSRQARWGLVSFIPVGIDSNLHLKLGLGGYGNQGGRIQHLDKGPHLRDRLR